MSADLNKKMLSGFSHEIRSYLPFIQEGIEKFKDDATQHGVLDDALRYIHTIKGASALMGLSALSQIASYIEQVLDDIVSENNYLDNLSHEWLCLVIEKIDPYLDSLLNGDGENQSIINLIEKGYFQIRDRADSIGEVVEEEICNDLVDNMGNKDVLQSSWDGKDIQSDANLQKVEYIEKGEREEKEASTEDLGCNHTEDGVALLEATSDSENSEKKSAQDFVRDSEYQDQPIKSYYSNDFEEEYANSGKNTSNNLYSSDIQYSDERDKELQECNVSEEIVDIVDVSSVESEVNNSDECDVDLKYSAEADIDNLEINNITTSLGDCVIGESKEAISEDNNTYGDIDGSELCVDEDKVKESDDERHTLNVDNKLTAYSYYQSSEFEDHVEDVDSQQFGAADIEPDGIETSHDSFPPQNVVSDCHVKPSDHLEEIISQIDDQVRETYENIGQVSSRPMSLLGIDSRQRHLLFTVGKSRYAASVNNIIEIGSYPSITLVPNVPRWVKGVINLRGEVFSVIDLKDFFENVITVYTDDERLIVVKTEDGSIMTSFLVDQINGFALLETEVSKNASEMFQDKVGSYLNGVFELEGMVFAALDIERLLKSPEINQFY